MQEKYATLKKITETLYDLVEKEFPMLENKIEKLNQKVQEGIQKTELSERTITKTYSSLRKQLNVVSAKIDDRDNAASSFAESAIDDTYATLLKFFSDLFESTSKELKDTYVAANKAGSMPAQSFSYSQTKVNHKETERPNVRENAEKEKKVV